MSGKKMGLGRGLNTLIPKAPIVDEEDVEQVKKKVSRILISHVISLMKIHYRNYQIQLNNMECCSQFW